MVPDGRRRRLRSAIQQSPNAMNIAGIRARARPLASCPAVPRCLALSAVRMAHDSLGPPDSVGPTRGPLANSPPRRDCRGNCGAITIKPRHSGAFSLADCQTLPAASQIPHVQRDLWHEPPPDREPVALSPPSPASPPGPPKTAPGSLTSPFLSVPRGQVVSGPRNEKSIGGGGADALETPFRPLQLTDGDDWTRARASIACKAYTAGAPSGVSRVSVVCRGSCVLTWRWPDDLRHLLHNATPPDLRARGPGSGYCCGSPATARRADRPDENWPATPAGRPEIPAQDLVRKPPDEYFGHTPHRRQPGARP